MCTPDLARYSVHSGTLVEGNGVPTLSLKGAVIIAYRGLWQFLVNSNTNVTHTHQPSFVSRVANLHSAGLLVVRGRFISRFLVRSPLEFVVCGEETDFEVLVHLRGLSRPRYRTLDNWFHTHIRDLGEIPAHMTIYYLNAQRIFFLIINDLDVEGEG